MARVRSLLRRTAPRAEVIAPPEVHLGGRLDVAWPDPQPSERRPFFLTLPREPYTFRGRLLALEWTLELVALPREEKTSAPLILAPGRRAIDLVHRELRK